MKIRNLSKVALAIALSSGILVQGCKKYDDDISRLEQKIDANKSALEAQMAALKEASITKAVKNVESIEGGLKITFVDSQGTETTQNITVTGTPGQDGEDGINAPVFSIGDNGNWWRSIDGGAPTDTGNKAIGKDGKDGKDGTDGKDGENGTDGKDGKDGTDGVDGKDGAAGTKVELIEVGGKKYWSIDGVNTGVLAYGGAVAAIPTDGGFKVSFVNADGTSTEDILLHTEAVAVNGLSIVPEFTDQNSAIVFFPRIVDNNSNRATILQGYGIIKYNLNPFGVKTANYNASGLLTQETDKVKFRSSGGDVSSLFTEAKPATKDFGDIVVRYKPTGNPNSWFPKADDASKNLHIALQIENYKAEAHQKYVASEFNIAKEEIIEADEVTIEKSVTNPDAEGDKVTLRNGVNPNFNGVAFVDQGVSSRTLAHSKSLADDRSAAHFELHYKDNATRNLDGNTAYKGAVVLDDELNGFFGRFQVGNKVVSMDDHGLEDYNLRYDIDHYASSAQERNWLNLENPATGKISVKISTTNDDAYNSAAINNHAIVRVRLYAGEGSAPSALIATRYIKVSFVQNPAEVIDVEGAFTHDVVAAATTSKTISWLTPLTLDAAYNKTGRSAADFHQVYSFELDPAYTNPAGLTFDIASMNSDVQGDARIVNVSNTVMPGTYVLKGRYKSSVSSDDIVNVKITVTITGNKISQLTKNAPFWDAAFQYGIINGKLVGGAWELHADLWDYWTETTITGATKPVVEYEFSVVTPSQYGGGITIVTDEVQLEEAIAQARAKVNNGDVTLRVIRKVNGVTYNTGIQTGVGAEPNGTDFKVRFQNPVKAIVAKTPYKVFKDKEVSGSNLSTVDARRLVQLKDFNNTMLFNFDGAGHVANVFEPALNGYYGISGVNAAYDVTDIEFVRAENTSGQSTTLPTSTRAFVDGNDLVWENNGANLQQAIVLVYEVTITNKFNIGDVNSTKTEVVKEIKVRVNPNN